jgi:tetratricopeptide (TPR) repeat protein
MSSRNAPCPCGSGKKFKKCCADQPPPEQLQELRSLANTGAFDRLESGALALAHRYPTSGFTWQLLGLALWRQGKDPLHALERAARCLPRDAEAASNLGNALRSAGMPERAVAEQRRALILAPSYALAHNNLGSALQDLGRWEEAAQSYAAATALDPLFAQAHCNLGNALLQLGRAEAAVASYRSALQVQPDNIAAIAPMGAALRDLGNLDAAAAAFRRGLELKPDSAELHYNLAVILRLQNRSDEAQTAACTAVELNPGLSAALVLLARLEVDRGSFPQAEALLQRAIELEPDSPQAWSAVPSLRRMTPDDSQWLETVQRIVAAPLPARHEMHLRYALGKYFDDVREFSAAFSNYRRANELKKTIGPRHDRVQLTKLVDRILQIPVERVPRRATMQPQAPIFVIGMPRSGTSLAEQILASHPCVVGGGELSYWGNALRTFLSAGADSEALVPLAREYRDLLARLGGQADRIVDKMPTNFLAAGIILEALPDARLIHMRRDPIDTCLSIYFQDFESAYSYANDLSDLAHGYREYLRIMDHWRACLDADSMLEVPYEQLVAEPERWTRRMLEFVQLPFDAACLDFHRTPRTVSTVSSWQVRQSINRNSVARWRNYLPFIGPLQTLAEAEPLRLAAT